MKTPTPLIMLLAVLSFFSAGVFALDQTNAITHDIQHDPGSGYTGITLSLSDNGVATVAGHVDDAIDRERIKRWLMNDKRVTDVINLIDTD